MVVGGGCDEHFKYFYPSACGGVNQPIEKKIVKLYYIFFPIFNLYVALLCALPFFSCI